MEASSFFASGCYAQSFRKKYQWRGSWSVGILVNFLSWVYAKRHSLILKTENQWLIASIKVLLSLVANVNFCIVSYRYYVNML